MIELSTIEQTRRLAKQVFTQALSKTSPYMIALEGEIGVGKSEFIRQGLHSLGYYDPVPSPTFTIYHIHQIAKLNVVHADFYRLADLDELLMIGWDEVVDGADLVLIEWASQIGMKTDLEIEISLHGRQRFAKL
ncbi:tRNA (adenosine(37)-N6)-threonylcarbamoyltransferase complex ATPase subunit type 1 TsaE [Gammaproteobacteria bacterium]|nr:tRNA (adenosine(37)-N6)-threonylcarbamoyltransferase complex ATPase subunit type 1 TsaE [Gammaproteobacteria bacterium]